MDKPKVILHLVPTNIVDTRDGPRVNHKCALCGKSLYRFKGNERTALTLHEYERLMCKWEADKHSVNFDPCGEPDAEPTS